MVDDDDGGESYNYVSAGENVNVLYFIRIQVNENRKLAFKQIILSL